MASAGLLLNMEYVRMFGHIIQHNARHVNKQSICISHNIYSSTSSLLMYTEAIHASQWSRDRLARSLGGYTMTRLPSLVVVTVMALLLSLTLLPNQTRADNVSIMSGNFVAQYFNNMTLSGSPAVTRSDASINFSWGDGSPDPAINPDHFSARWTGTIPVAVAGTYVFSLTTDDGARLWVDGALLIDKWYDQPPTTHTASVALTAAAHTIKVEYYEDMGQATIALSWGLAGPAENFIAEYFNNMSLFGSPVLTRVDSVINFDWGYDSPALAVPPDYFSARWTGTFNFATTDDYDFHVRIDDGARLFLDGILILDKWFPQAPTEYTVTRNVTAGPHQIKMEYFEEAGIAVAKLWWNPHGAGGSDVIVDDLSAGFTKGGAFYQAAIGFNSHMFYTRNAYNAQEAWGRWTPTLTAPGQYEVFVFIPSNRATTRNARYSVYHNGVWNTRSVNQYIYYDVWVSLGTYYFSAAGGEFVFLPDVTYEPYLSRYVGYDAVKFVYRGP